MNEFLKKEVKKNKSLIDKFCSKYKLEFKGPRLSHEDTTPKIMYHFSDGNGGYTADTIKKDLKRKSLFKVVYDVFKSFTSI